MPHVLEFEKHCKVPVKIHMRFEKIRWDLLYRDVAGYCFEMPGIKYIHIDYNWWFKMKNEKVKEELIFHELGHCILNRGHTKERIYEDTPGGRPKSIMYPYVFGHWGEYEHFRLEYIKELCKPTK